MFTISSSLRLISAVVLVGEIIARAHRVEHMPVDDDLRPRIVRRFEQDGIHGNLGRHASSFGLHDLCATHFGTFRRNRRVECHVLRFERRHAQAILRQHAAKTSYEQTLARSRHRALDHDRFRGHEHTSRYLSISPDALNGDCPFLTHDDSAARNALFSSSVRTAMRYQLLSRPTKFSQRRMRKPFSSSGSYRS